MRIPSASRRRRIMGSPRSIAGQLNDQPHERLTRNVESLCPVGVVGVMVSGRSFMGSRRFVTNGTLT